MSEKSNHAPPGSAEVAAKRRRDRNWAVLITLSALSLLLFAITIAKMIQL